MALRPDRIIIYTCKLYIYNEKYIRIIRHYLNVYGVVSSSGKRSNSLDALRLPAGFLEDLNMVVLA